MKEKQDSSCCLACISTENWTMNESIQNGHEDFSSFLFLFTFIKIPNKALVSVMYDVYAHWIFFIILLVNLGKSVMIYVFHTAFKSCVKPFCDTSVKRSVSVCFSCLATVWLLCCHHINDQCLILNKLIIFYSRKCFQSCLLWCSCVCVSLSLSFPLRPISKHH